MSKGRSAKNAFFTVNNDMKVICDVNEPSAIAYQDVFEDGDEWVKVNSCQGCPIESVRLCCAKCPMLLEDGKCMAHMGMTFRNKPYECITKPYPNTTFSFCQLKFKCTKGKNVGKIKKISEPHLHLL